MNRDANRRRAVWCLVLMSAAGALVLRAFAQNGPDTAHETQTAAQGLARASFDTVAIHPNKEGDSGPERIYGWPRSGSLRAVNAPLSSLMEFAYDIPDLRMIGGPGWVKTARYSLDAKADPEVDRQLASLPLDQVRQIRRQMLAAMLQERFKLAVHRESREMPVYALVVAKGGPKLESKPGAEPPAAGNDRIQIAPGGDSLQYMAYELSWRLGRPVLDRTGLQYRQGLTLRWQTDDTPSDAGAPSLFTAIQEQLGLKLEPSRASVPVLVIDHAERPTEN